MLPTILLGAALAAAREPAPDPLLQQDPATVGLVRQDRGDYAATRERVERFLELSPMVGARAPAFRLPDLAGRTVALSDYRGKKPVVLVFGSASCFVFRRGYPALAERLKTRFGARVVLHVVYTLEAHPALGDVCPYSGAPWIGAPNVQDRVLVRQPRDAAERLDVARAFAARFKLDPATILVDGLDDSVWRVYGALTASVFAVDQDGIVVYKESWLRRGGPEAGPDPAPALQTALDRRRPR